MRITFVSVFGPPLVGGFSKLCLELAQQLQKHGHDVKIATRFTHEVLSIGDRNVRQEPPRSYCHEGVDIHVIPISEQTIHLFAWRMAFRIAWRSQRLLPGMAQVCYQSMERSLTTVCEDCDVLHYFGSGWDLLGFAAGYAARRRGIPFVVQPAIHEGEWGQAPIDRQLYATADAVEKHLWDSAYAAYATIYSNVLEQGGR